MHCCPHSSQSTTSETITTTREATWPPSWDASRHSACGSTISRMTGRCWVAALGWFLLGATPALGQTPRPMTVDDVLALQSITGVVPSPDGKWLAAVIKRPDGPPDEMDADVWLVPSHGGAPRKLTQAGGPRTRWWNPVW